MQRLQAPGYASMVKIELRLKGGFYRDWPVLRFDFRSLPTSARTHFFIDLARPGDLGISQELCFKYVNCL